MRRLNRKWVDALSISNYVIKKGFSHGVRHGKSEEQIYHHQAYNAWKQCRKKKDAQGETYTKILNRFWEVRDIENHKKNLDGTKLSVQKWTSWYKNITLTSWRSPSVCYFHQIEVFNSTVQEVMLRWPLDLIIALPSHWKITCTDIRKFIKNQSHHKIKTEYVKTPSSQKHTVKKLESTKKLGGNSGNLLLLLQAGGSVINGTGNSMNQVSADLILIVFYFVTGSDFVYSRWNPL